MAINILDVEEVLRQRLHPLTLVSLNALNPAREPYRAILLQPTGMVEANDVRVGHADAALGDALCSGFLSSAAQSYSDLAVAPEYCVPWSVVQKNRCRAFSASTGCHMGAWMRKHLSDRSPKFGSTAQRGW